MKDRNWTEEELLDFDRDAESYLNKEMDYGARLVFRDKLYADKTLRDRFEILKLIFLKRKKNSQPEVWESTRKDLEYIQEKKYQLDGTRKSKWSTGTQGITLVGILLIVLSAVWWVNRGDEDTNGYIPVEIKEPYPIGFPENESNTLGRAMISYNQSDWPAAEELAYEFLQEPSSYREIGSLVLASSQVYQGDFASPLSILENIKDSDLLEDYKDVIDYYMALSYLNNKAFPKAREILERTKNSGDSFVSENSKIALEKMNMLQ